MSSDTCEHCGVAWLEHEPGWRLDKRVCEVLGWIWRPHEWQDDRPWRFRCSSDEKHVGPMLTSAAWRQEWMLRQVRTEWQVVKVHFVPQKSAEQLEVILQVVIVATGNILSLAAARAIAAEGAEE